MSKFPAAALATLALWAPQAGATDAEFAVRWDPRQGGPATPEDTMRELRLTVDERSQAKVEYFEFTPPPGLPEGFTPILRQRTSGPSHELSFKLRGSQPLPDTPTLKHWDCPLGPTDDRKDEVDVGFVAADRTMIAYSRSCDLNTRDAAAPPPALKARPKGCASTMTRLRSGKLKIEEWRLADGSVLLEASRPGKHNAKSTRAFEHDVLKPLLALKIQPLERSKSAIGSDCK
jgi:hypothetical protein